METKPEETNPAEVKAEVAAKAETAEAKPSKPDMKPVIAAMRKLGDLAMSDVATLERHCAKPRRRDRRRAPNYHIGNIQQEHRTTRPEAIPQ